MLRRFNSVKHLTRTAIPARWSSADAELRKFRNFGISAHIDSGKTTLSERILYYTGKIEKIHEVSGGDGPGATMDSMELEKERGITIKSAATHVTWKGHPFNIIDTPGHVDFTIEVERALKVLDGAILVVCAVGGVQCQTRTVVRQMDRYEVPRIIFINKLDRTGADPDAVIHAIRSRLHTNTAFVQYGIGTGNSVMPAVVDVINQEIIEFAGQSGSVMKRLSFADAAAQGLLAPVGNVAEFETRMGAFRGELVERLGDVDKEIEELFLMEETPSPEQLKAAIRRTVLNRTFSPTFCGAALKNTGIQPILDGVVEYLPDPTEKPHKLLKQLPSGDVEEVHVRSDPNAPLLAMTFKLEEQKLGMLTYLKIFNGALTRATSQLVTPDGKTVKLSGLYRMHADKTEAVTRLGAGDVGVAVLPELPTGTTLTDGKSRFLASPMHVPPAVIALSCSPVDVKMSSKMSQALQRFAREDPSFRIAQSEDRQLEMLGMGELHLEIYAQRLEREYGVKVNLGSPSVRYREAISEKIEFHHRFKRQSGGRGMFAELRGYVEPIPVTSDDPSVANEFDGDAATQEIPINFVRSSIKRFREAFTEGIFMESPVVGVRVVLTGGMIHDVDSSDMAFRYCVEEIIAKYFTEDKMVIREPWMTVEINVPTETLDTVMLLVGEKGVEVTEVVRQGEFSVINGVAPMRAMTGFIVDLRRATAGVGEFSMEYAEDRDMPPFEGMEVAAARRAQLKARRASLDAAQKS